MFIYVNVSNKNMALCGNVLEFKTSSNKIHKR